MRIAAAAFAVAREARAEAPILPISPVHDRRPSRGPSHGRDRNAREEGYVRLAIDAGRDEGVLPKHVVSAIARTADIPGRALGKILINDTQTLVDVPANFVDQVLAQSGDYRFGKRMAAIEKV